MSGIKPGYEVAVDYEGSGTRFHVVGPPADLLGPEQRVGLNVMVLPREPVASAKHRAIAEWWAFVGRERFVITELPETTLDEERTPRAVSELPPRVNTIVRIEGRGRRVRP